LLFKIGLFFGFFVDMALGIRTLQKLEKQSTNLKKTKKNGKTLKNGNRIAAENPGKTAENPGKTAENPGIQNLIQLNGPDPFQIAPNSWGH
jgi:hypothetical protein